MLEEDPVPGMRDSWARTLGGVALLIATMGGCGGDGAPPTSGAPAAAESDRLDGPPPSGKPGTTHEQPEWEAREEAEEGIHADTADAADRLGRFEFSPAAEGFGSVAVDYEQRRVDLWWHGSLPKRVRAVVAETRRAGQVGVSVHKAVQSKAQFQRRVDRIFADREMDAAGVQVSAVIGNLALSSVEIHIAEPAPDLIAADKAARCALAARLAHTASGLRVRKVDDRGDLLERNSPNPCGAPGLRNVSRRSPPR
jgi:hypothetical protein